MIRVLVNETEPLESVNFLYFDLKSVEDALYLINFCLEHNKSIEILKAKEE